MQKKAVCVKIKKFDKAVFLTDEKINLFNIKRLFSPIPCNLNKDLLPSFVEKLFLLM